MSALCALNLGAPRASSGRGPLARHDRARGLRAACRSSRTRRSRRLPRSRSPARGAVTPDNPPQRDADDSHAAPAPSAIKRVHVGAVVTNRDRTRLAEVVVTRHQHDERAHHELRDHARSCLEVDCGSSRARAVGPSRQSRRSHRASTCEPRRLRAPRDCFEPGLAALAASSRASSELRSRQSRIAAAATFASSIVLSNPIRARDSGQVRPPRSRPRRRPEPRRAPTRRTHAAHVMPRTGKSIVVSLIGLLSFAL